MGNIYITATNKIDNNIVLPKEEVSMLNLIKDEKTRLESTLGRQCIRKLLISLNKYKSYPILRGKIGEPMFPKGILGTISHTESIAIGAITDNKTIKAIGIDIQTIKKFPAQQRFITSKEDNLIGCSLLGILSIKESIYKALYSLYGIRIPYNCIESSYIKNKTILSKLDIKHKNLYTDSDMILTIHRVVKGLIFSLTIII